MRCPNCNNEVPQGKRFCGHCGYRLEPTASTPDTFNEDAPTRMAPSRPQESPPPSPESPEAKPEPAKVVNYGPESHYGRGRYSGD